MGVRTFGAGHGEDVALEVALEDAPRALVDHEWRLAHEPRVEVRLGHDPRRGVRDALGMPTVSRLRHRSVRAIRGAQSWRTYKVQNLP